MCRRSPSFGEVFRLVIAQGFPSFGSGARLALPKEASYDPDVQPTDLRTICVGGLHRSVRFPSSLRKAFRLLGRAPALRFQKRLHRPRRPAHGPPHDMCRRSPSFGEVFRRHCGGLSVFWVGLPPCASKRGFIRPRRPAHGPPHDMCRRSPSFGEVFRRHCGRLFPSFGSGSRLALPKEASYDPDVQPTDLRTICVGGLHRSVRFSVVIAQGFPSFGSGSRPAFRLLGRAKEASYDPDVQPTDLRTICVGGLHRSVRFSVVIAQGFPSFGSGSCPALPKEASDTRTCNPRTSARYVQEVLVQAISLRGLRPRGRGPKSSPPS